MDQIITVIAVAAVLFGITLVGCYLPFLLKRDSNHLHTLIAFSGGVMLGVLFIMLMPEAFHETIEAEFDFKTACYMVMAGFVLLFVIDFLVKKYLGFDEHDEDEHAHSITSLSAFSGLAIHSFFDGLALAAAFTAGESIGLLVLVGLCLHKTVVAFSLASTMIMGENPRTAWTYLIVFALVSPLATVISYAFLNSGEFAYTGPALCLSAGIFMFVTMCDILPEAFHHRNNDAKQLLFLLLGLAVAIIVAVVSGSLMGDLH
ncbi:MAG: ZIP family metal transporter [Candidatus Methanomethylophilus sp.]|nr:ZIP family metal transporter [Methanomethylophilus sp.]